MWFRASAKQQTDTLRLGGWVRNAPDGAVEIVVEGDRDALEPFLAWCHRGPDGARVDAVEVTEIPEGEREDFRIIP